MKVDVGGYQREAGELFGLGTLWGLELPYQSSRREIRAAREAWWHRTKNLEVTHADDRSE